MRSAVKSGHLENLTSEVFRSRAPDVIEHVPSAATSQKMQTQSLRQLHCEPCAYEDPAIDGHVRAPGSGVQLHVAMHTGILGHVQALRLCTHARDRRDTHKRGKASKCFEDIDESDYI